jgi:hypothetical protein
MARKAVRGDVAFDGDRIAAVGRITGKGEDRRQGLYVAPGFIDMHSHSEEDASCTRRGPSFALQAYTEIYGETTSMGPLGGSVRRHPDSLKGNGNAREFLTFMEQQGIDINVASTSAPAGSAPTSWATRIALPPRRSSSK